MAFMGLGSNTQLGIGIAIRMYDQYSAQVKGAEKSLKKLRDAANSATMGAIQDARNRYAGIAAGAGILTAGLMKANKESATLEHTIRKIAIVGGDMTGKTQKKLESMVFRLGDMFGSSYGDVADAVLENTKAGITENIELITKYQIAVSKVADEQLGGSQGVASGMINIANQFHINTSQMGRVGNALVAAANASKADISSLNEGMKQFGSTAFQLGLTPEQAIAMLAKAENAGLRGSMGGTHVRNFFVQAAKNAGQFMSKDSAAAWAGLGINPRDIQAMVNTGHADQLIDLVENAIVNVPRMERISYLNKLFNLRGQSGIQALFGMDEHGNIIKNAQGGQQASYADLLKKTEAGVAGDVVMKQAQAMSDDFWSDMNKAKNAMTQFFYKFYSNVKPFLRIAYQFAAGFMHVASYLVSTNVGKVLSAIVMAAAPVVTLLFTLKAALMGLVWTLNMTQLRGMRGGGFFSLLSAGMNMFGLRGAKNTIKAAGVTNWTPGFAAAFNKHGNPYVPKGAGIMMNSTLYKGGAALPRAMNWGVSAATVGMGTAAAAGRMGVIGSVGKAAANVGKGIVGGIGGLLGRFFPIVGGVLLAVDLLEGVNSWLQQKSAEELEEKRNREWDPIDRYYQAALSGGIFSEREANAAKMWQQSFGKQLNNNITVNIDGVNVGSATQQGDITKEMDNTFDFYPSPLNQ